ncbi:hypothetical protein MCOR02_000181 [Pyricularia oryzae]|uniref:Cytochrome P450 n=1 Tax=Pyricularia grisea TaxID=148305 RepID=A0ABQ8NC51_PYRGI|nr:hypothetical protein MCOR01_010157 [Pyricularia oryzae]KAI6294716.1 hypothetical protein MCOR33_008220 [Pyricularia grisea]KAH9436507.1 hypothetical protein MCOR02_000181 [Pyricularia oryzae]KAI6256412.1 hypothetical protein MCOR19_007131 [Pyricularia oryzae]KAI6305494.1 hypothetical protein MCOR29_010453 [Pyricularia oryzae]
MPCTRAHAASWSLSCIAGAGSGPSASPRGLEPPVYSDVIEWVETEAAACCARARSPVPTPAGGESISQLVSATADHLPFGYGKYACPGRFFVAHEVKPVALCYPLLKHDWKTSENATVHFTIDAGLDALVNPEVKVKYRRRKEEIGLDLPVFGATEWIEERCSQLGEKWKSPLQRWLVCDQPCCWDLIYIPMMGNLPSQVSNLNLSAYMPVNSWSLIGPS